jgi:recombination protein RecR
MARLPGVIEKLINSLERLPGIGPKSASRIAFYLLGTPSEFIEGLAENLRAVKSRIKICRQCFGVSETELCEICGDSQRDRKQICVVERAIDVVALEKIGGYQGVYHVLGGVINPLEHVGPEEIRIAELVERLDGVWELILAMNPTMEGEATALYIKNQIVKSKKFKSIKLTRIGSGLPIGADLEFADSATLNRAMEGRKEI